MKKSERDNSEEGKTLEEEKNRSDTTGKWGYKKIKREGDTEREWERGRNCS